MFIQILPENTKKLLTKLASQSWISPFYLSGGTALTIQIGHRESDDLDFFSQDDFEPLSIQINLEKIGQLKEVSTNLGTLNCMLDDVKLQFLHYPYQILEQPDVLEQLKISSPLDIACTKLITISSRGFKRDFIDLYYLLKIYKLPFIIDQLKNKYPKTNYNLTHILKSLTYFENAEDQPQPKMFDQVSWPEIKKSITDQVTAISKQF